MDYHVSLTMMTPLHIGTGTDLLNEYDFKVHRNRTYRLNVDAIWDHVLSGDAQQVDRHLLHTPPARLIEPRDLVAHPEFAAYVLHGRPQPESEGAGRVREQIKNAYGQLYLPGSSLKGALRTALARSIGRKQPLPLRVNDRPGRRGQPDPRRADDWLEADLFRPGGDDANHDLLRALQVADSQPVDTSPVLMNVRVVKKDQRASPIDVEAVPAGTTFETTIRVDDYLLRTVAGDLGWDAERTNMLYALPSACRSVAGARFAQEHAYFAAAGLPGLAQTYRNWQRELQGLSGSGTFFVQVGWGAGWDSKTVGSDLVSRDERAFAGLRNMFGLGRPPKAGRDWAARPGDPFPSSRRLVVRSDGQPIYPLGWVVVEMTPRERVQPVLADRAEKTTAVPPPEPPLELAPALPPELAPALPPELVPAPSAEPPPELQPEPSPVPPAAPIRETPEAQVQPGPHTGTVVRYNMMDGKGAIAVEGGEVEVRASQLRKGVRYLSSSSRVSFTVVRDEDGVHLEDVGPA